MITVNACDFGHTTEEVRVLPVSEGGSNIIICKKCFKVEMKSRHRDSMRYGVENYEFPKWKDLKIYEAC